MPAHVKSSLLGCSVTVPISRGALNLGTWQGIWLGEHRDDGGSRRIVVSERLLRRSQPGMQPDQISAALISPSLCRIPRLRSFCFPDRPQATISGAALDNAATSAGSSSSAAR